MTYEFKVGDKGKTREGKPYEVVAHYSKSSKNPLIVAIEQHPGSFTVGSYSVDGRWAPMTLRENQSDLIPPPRKLTFYVNVYEDDIYGYSSEEDATSSADSCALLVAQKVVFEIEGGAP